ncbi:MAG: (d)CMP kinase [Thermomicrobiales bacterium]|nr:(d)CMP kinase [Thermomicrobiales bacterium]
MVETSAAHRWVVAIDGPAAAGKSTVAQLLADRLGALLFDTGSLYRALALAVLRAEIDPADECRLAELAAELDIAVVPPTVRDGRLATVHLDGEDVTWEIRAPAVDAVVSPVSAHPAVRAALLPHQRRIASGLPVVIVGRDIGSVVVPDAGVKIFLEASPEERARRRFAELRERGVEVDFDAVLADLRRRDAIDTGRAASPLRAAADALVLNTDRLTVPEVVDRIEERARAIWTPTEAVVRGETQ